MLDNNLEEIQKRLLACRKRLATLPIDMKKPTLEIGHFLVPCWRSRQTQRADDSYNIVDSDYDGKITPETIAMFVPKEEANFIINAPTDIAFMLTITEYALALIPALKEKIKQLEGESSKTIVSNK